MFVYGEYAEYAFDDMARKSWRNDSWATLGTMTGTAASPLSGRLRRIPDKCKRVTGAQLSLADGGRRGDFLPDRRGICFFLFLGMKSVHQKKEADAYLTEGGLHLTQQYDRYTHTTQTRTKIEKKLQQ